MGARTFGLFTRLQGDRKTNGVLALRHTPDMQKPGVVNHAGLSSITLDQSSMPETFQMSFAYSRMVRSEENQPVRAVLSTAACHQRSGVRQSLSLIHI